MAERAARVATIAASSRAPRLEAKTDEYSAVQTWLVLTARGGSAEQPLNRRGRSLGAARSSRSTIVSGN
jgi:hypothetical protein